MEHLSSRGAARQLRHAPLGLANSINRAGQTITEPFDEANPVAMALTAGSFSLHHEFAAHRSAPNNASHRRIGIGLNYIPTHVRVGGPIRCCAMLVRGQDNHGHFDLIEPPSAERDATALAVHQQVSDRYRENYQIQVTRHEQLYAGAGAQGSRPVPNSTTAGLRRDYPDQIADTAHRVEFPCGEPDCPVCLARHDDLDLLERVPALHVFRVRYRSDCQIVAHEHIMKDRGERRINLRVDRHFRRPSFTSINASARV
jgi:hypothetical protein